MKKNANKLVKKIKNPKEKEPMSPQKKLAIKITLVFVILGSILCAVVFGAIYLYQAICTNNSNYILRKVEVVSNGYWDGKDSLIRSFLKLEISKANIFLLDIEELRTKALSIPGVKQCEVKRILPDTIRFDFIERVPRASISGHPAYLIDEQGIVLLKKYCMQSAGTLPMIIGISKQHKLIPNKQEKNLYNAMQILLLTLRHYSDIEIVAIDVSGKDFLKMYVRYAKGKLRQAIMPDDMNNAELRLKALRTALIRSHNANDNVRIYNLSFDGRVVCQ